MVKKTKLACPKCNGTAFEVYHVEVEDFFSTVHGYPRSLYFTMEKCMKCGWESNVTDKDRIRDRISIMLRREPITWEGFVTAQP